MSVKFAVDRRALPWGVRLMCCLVCCFLAGVLAFASAPAFAKTAHVLGESFGKAGSGAGELALDDTAGGVAVDEETHNVYVADAGNNRVDEFSSAGAFIRAFGADVGGSGVDVCTTSCVAGTSGASPGALEEPTFIAIDNDPLSVSHGDVYVGDRGDNLVSKFTPEGVLESAWGTDGQLNGAGAEDGPFGKLAGVVVNGSGDLSVLDENEHWFKFSADGSAEPTVGVEDSVIPLGIGIDSAGDFYKVRDDGGNLQQFTASGVELLEYTGFKRVTAFAIEASTNDIYLVQGGEVARIHNESESQIERFGFGRLGHGVGVAVDPATETVYVADSSNNEIAAFVPGVIPDVAVESISSFPSTASATLKGTVEPDGTTVTTCEFEYGTAPGVYTNKAQCAPAPPFSEQSAAVSATATGLTQGKTYYYRLSAGDAGGIDSSVEQKFVQPYAAKIEGESSSFDEAKAVTLEATINPGGAEASYHFEYGPAEGVYDVSVPIPDREIAAGLTGVNVSVGATGLAPGTTYHYRVVVENGLPGAVDGPDETFTTLTPQGTGSPASCPNEQARAEQPYGLGLPDCRAYEQVSPVDKEGGNVEDYAARAAVSGEAIAYFSENSFSEPPAAAIQSVYISRRGPDGWTTQNITPPERLSRESNQYHPYEEMFFTPELTKGLFVQPYSSLSSEIPAGYTDLYVANFAERSYQLVTNVAPQRKPYEPEYSYYHYVGVAGGSADLSHVVFSEGAALTPGASPNQPHVYEGVDGRLHQIDIAPEGTTFTGAGSGGPHAVSENGLRVFFTAGEAGGQLYVRENPEQPQSPEEDGKCTVSADACTVEVSASERKQADPHGPQSAQFRGASADGSRVFFTSNAELTDDANTGEEDNAANLYEYDLEAPEGERLTDLTVDTNPADVKDGAEVDGVADIGEDGSYVYFVAQGELAGNENSDHDRAESGKRNLYLYHDGAVAFIATLSPSDQYGEEGNFGSRVSADGTHLAFVSERSLTGYDNQPVEHHFGCGPEGCNEVYLFDATTGSLVCASCDPSGARPVGPAWMGGSVPGALTETAYTARNLSENGSRLFFNSYDPLVPHVSNGLNNVYEYEDGHVYLISDGAGPYESDFLDTSVSGDDVFFTTRDGLLPQDQDERVDVYDARVGGGFPVAAVVAPCDNGDSCRGPESSQPGVFGAPGSATFSGVGNLPPSPPVAVRPAKKTGKCAKGFVKNKKGRCVKRRKKAKRARKSTHGKGSK